MFSQCWPAHITRLSCLLTLISNSKTDVFLKKIIFHLQEALILFTKNHCAHCLNVVPDYWSKIGQTHKSSKLSTWEDCAWEVNKNSIIAERNNILRRWLSCDSSVTSFIVWVPALPGYCMATRAGKMEQLSYPLKTTRCVQQEKFPWKPYNNSLLTELDPSRWLDISLVLLFASLWTSTPTRSINTHKRTWPISNHLNLTLGQQPIYKSEMKPKDVPLTFA